MDELEKLHALAISPATIEWIRTHLNLTPHELEALEQFRNTRIGTSQFETAIGIRKPKPPRTPTASEQLENKIATIDFGGRHNGDSQD